MKLSFTSFFPKAFLLFATMVWTTTILLSTFHFLTRPVVSSVSLLSVVIFGYISKREKLRLFVPRTKVALLISCLFLLTFVQGVSSAPNTTDSMIYHLPRVMYWIQGKSIFLDQKVTSHDYMPALSESLVMYFMILTGNDRLAFLPQWLAGIAVVCTSALIATQLKLSPHSRTFGIILVATLPILLLQSASTQTDLVMTAFLLLSVYFSIKKQILPLAIAVALGIMAKQVFAVFAIIPFVLILPELIRTRIQTVTIATILGLALVAPLFVSNMHLYGTLMGSQLTADGRTLVLTNEKMNLGLFLSNVIRNTLIQTPLPLIGKYIDPYVSNDPSTTWYGAKFSSSSVFIPQEDIASAPIHLMLIFGALFLCFQAGVHPLQRKLLVLSCLSFLLFSALLKWQPYNPRLEMALIVVMMPAVVGILSKYTQILKGLVTVSILLGFLTIIANTSHSFFSYDVVFARLANFAPAGQLPPQSIFTQPRIQQYFSARPYWYGPYTQIVSDVVKTGTKTVSVSLADEFSYPLLHLLHVNGVTYSSTASNRIESTVGHASGRNNMCYATAIPYGQICYQ